MGRRRRWHGTARCSPADTPRILASPALRNGAVLRRRCSLSSYRTVFIPAWPGCSALLSVRSAFTAAPKHRNVLQTVLPNMQDTDVASRGGGCPRWPGSCDGDPGTGLQLSPVPSAGVPGHLTALLPADKPRSLPRASLGGAIPPSECAHRVQPRLFPTRVLLVIKGELQSFIASSINAP